MSEAGEENVVNPAERTDVDYRKLPYIGKKISALDVQVGEEGISSTVNDFLEKSGIHVIPRYSRGSLEALSNDPVLVVASHPDLLSDTLGIVGALPSGRRNISIVGNPLQTRMGPNVAEHIISIHGVAQQPTKSLELRLVRKLLAGYLQLDDNRSPLRLGRANMPALDQMEQKLSDGGLVILFPEGSREEGGEWYTGLGETVVRVQNKERTKVIFAKTEGQKWRNRGRLISPKGGIVFGKGDLKVHFSEPHEMTEYNGEHRRDITKKLRSQYDEFLLEKM